MMRLQLVDDLLDYEGDQAVLGKPANSDLKLGIITAPVFFALQEDESIRPLVLRRFSHPGDVEKVPLIFFLVCACALWAH